MSKKAQKAQSRVGSQMKDVAERAGVSVTTVSHMVNNTRPLAPATRARVLEVMRELNFYKNSFARRLARGRSDSYGLIISDILNPFFPELIKSFENEVLRASCDVFLCTTNYDPDRAQHAVRRMIENRVLGVAVMTSQLDSDLIQELTENDIPVVRLDPPEGKRRAHSVVRVDYSTGAAEAVQHLRDLGHERITFISGPQTRISARTYCDAFVKSLEQIGMPPAQVVEGNGKMDGGEAAVRRLLDQGHSATALLCGNDLTALGAMLALSEAGLQVPDDISVIGGDDIPFACYSTPALTTVRVPQDEVGQAAFTALDRMVRTKHRLGAEILLKTHLVIRRSTGPARKSTRKISLRPR